SVALEADARRGLGLALDDLADRPTDAGLRGTVDELVAELGRREYQVRDLGDTRTYDVSMIAAPVFGTSGEVALALTLVGFQPGLAAPLVAALGERVRDVALVLTRRSGGRLPSTVVS